MKRIKQTVQAFVLTCIFMPTAAMAQDKMEIPDNVKGMLEKVEVMQRLPINAMAAVKAKGVDEVFFVDQSGRFYIRGTIHDMWNGQKALTTIEEIQQASQSTGLAQKKLPFNEMKPLSYGKGDKKVVLFVDPYCPYCHTLIQDILRRTHLASEYTFKFLAIPALGQKSVQRVRDLTCAIDQQQATLALLKGDNTSSLPQDKNCNPIAINKRLVTAKMLNLQSVPFIIAPDGRSHVGPVANLDLWLQGIE